MPRIGVERPQYSERTRIAFGFNALGHQQSRKTQETSHG
jgi:hypothetical protein